MQDFEGLRGEDINEHIQARRNEIFLLMEEVRRLRIQQRAKVSGRSGGGGRGKEGKRGCVGSMSRGSLCMSAPRVGNAMHTLQPDPLCLRPLHASASHPPAQYRLVGAAAEHAPRAVVPDVLRTATATATAALHAPNAPNAPHTYCVLRVSRRARR